MIDRSHDERGPLGARVLLFGAALALIPAALLTYQGVDWAVRGCGCESAFYPDWSWAVLLSMAVPFYGASLLLARRALGARDLR